MVEAEQHKHIRALQQLLPSGRPHDTGQEALQRARSEARATVEAEQHAQQGFPPGGLRACEADSWPSTLPRYRRRFRLGGPRTPHMEPLQRHHSARVI